MTSFNDSVICARDKYKIHFQSSFYYYSTNSADMLASPSISVSDSDIPLVKELFSIFSLLLWSLNWIFSMENIHWLAQWLNNTPTHSCSLIFSLVNQGKTAFLVKQNMLTSKSLYKIFYNKYFSLVEIISYLLWVSSTKSLH